MLRQANNYLIIAIERKELDVCLGKKKEVMIGLQKALARVHEVKSRSFNVCNLTTASFRNVGHSRHSPMHIVARYS